ncbi:hypothetical protein PLEOSDRAFT_161170 [Pleurotus ostreatus PC15]|uniref:Uncharacterized protein n=1 Tax=Pleurotus ostreatus (strain PC15) TaxID=1137138 RepID=A0A067NMH4_PLEO1|nr:hypothetical protein PLEOSDRAFT_161170 [Pleurotus ostreatus PC15]
MLDTRLTPAYLPSHAQLWYPVTSHQHAFTRQQLIVAAMLIVYNDAPSSSTPSASYFKAQTSSCKAQTKPTRFPSCVHFTAIFHPSPYFMSQLSLAQQPAAAQYNPAYAYGYYNAYAAAYGGQLRGVGANEYMGTINPGYW